VTVGDLYLELAVASIRRPELRRDVTFLVDTGATRAWLPEDLAHELGIAAEGTVALEMADGTVKEFPYGFCLFSFGDETVAGNVVIGPRGTEPLVGTHVLQDFRLVIDMDRHTISRRRAMRAR
jgi:predicted aspartyl protease